MSSTTAAPARSKRGKRKLDQAVEQEEKATAGGPAHPGDEAAPPTAPAPRLPHKFRQLDKPANLEAMLKEEKAGCVTAVTFGRDFGIRDGHLEQLALAAGPQLTELRLGSSDTGDGVYLTGAQLCVSSRTGDADGVTISFAYLSDNRASCVPNSCPCPRTHPPYLQLTDAAVDIIVRRCKNLDVLQLASCTGISNKAFAAICSGLPKLRELHVTGHDKSTGARPGHGRATQHA